MCPKHQLRLIIPGLDWPNTPGQGMETHIYTLRRTLTLLFAFQPIISLPLSAALFSRPSFRYVLECASCGVIYRSRQYWMGNQDPESGVVRSEVKHVWEDVSTKTCLTHVYI